MERQITDSQGWCTDRLDDGGIEPAPWSKTVAVRGGEQCHRPLRIASVVASCLAVLLAAGQVALASMLTDPAAREHDTYMAHLGRGLLLSEDVLVVTVVRHEVLERPGMRPRYWTRFEAVVDSVFSGDRSPGESVQFL
jgi:hypothetical protein